MRISVLLLTLLISSQLAGQDLVLTGVIDGPLTGGVPKAIEIHVTANVDDLSLYGVSSANNGAGTTGSPEFTFPAVNAVAGDYIYVATETTGFTSYMGFAPTYTSAAASINGDDAIELFFNGSVVDVFGDPDTDGTGQPWEYLDGWAYRSPGTGPDATFNSANWTYSGPNALDGETSNASSAVPFPVSTYDDNLPVTWLSFEGHTNGTELTLSWKTASELNNAGFEVEKSLDGHAFTQIGFVAGNGTTDVVQEYVHTDDKFYQSAYYRLKQLDFDERYDFSKTLFVMRTGATTFNLSPNPIVDKVRLTVSESSFNLAVVGIQGSSKEYVDLSSEEAATVIESLEGGMYFLTFYSPHFQSKVRLVKK